MEFRLPELGEGVYEAELVAWRVNPGHTIKRGQVLMEVLTDKATMEVPSPFAGTITALQAEPGQNIKVGQHVLTYTPAGTPTAAAPPEDGHQAVAGGGRRVVGESQITPPPATRHLPPGTRPVGRSSVVQAAPSVRYMARKMGIDLAQLNGTGSGGRILLEDLSNYVRATGPVEHRPAGEPAPDYGKPGTRIKLQGLRRKIAEHMVLAKRTIPHYSYVDECEVTDLVRLRDSLRDTYARAGIKLTYLAFFVKAAVLALKEVSIVNASVDDSAGEIILHDHYHVGIAVSTPGGLIVPVIHDADGKDLAAIAQDIERLSAEARAGKARLEDLRGGTFTITSVGGIGGLISTPVINHPEVAILGLGQVVKRPVYDKQGALRPADLIYLSFSFDHRALDGAVGAAFGNAMIRRLQNPATLLLPQKLLDGSD